MKNRQATTRFTNTVENYAQYRPSYPQEIIKLLTAECGLNANTVIADIGSGTGILTTLLLEKSNLVYAVEPNQAMRKAAEKILITNKHFRSIDGQSEQTTLPNHSVDLITAGQAFHWFDHLKAKTEFKRILRPKGWIALVWNLRDNEKSEFMRAYEQLLRDFGTDYEWVAAERIEIERIEEFFAPNKVFEKVYSNQQIFDWEGLKGRLLSTSYTPKPGQPGSEEMFKTARQMFEKYQQQGQIIMFYQTKIYYGQLLK